MKNTGIGRKILVHLLVFAIVAALLGVTAFVSAAPPAPTISAVSPNQGIQSQTLASVTITGNNFNGATSVSFGADVAVNSFTVISKNEITANITIASIAAPGPRDVSVTASGTGTLPSGFTVNYAPPTVSSVTPNQEIQGQSLNVTITGDYFSGATAVSFGLGVSVDSFTIDSATQITAGITISSAATPGTRNVSVTNPGGTGSLTNGFTVDYAPPTISSVNPNVGVQEQTLDVTITGTYFTAATLVDFGAGITTNSFIVNSATQIAANVTISYSAAPGPREVSVTAPGGTATFANSFGVNQAPPTVTSTSPSQGMQEETIYDVVVTGTHFTGATSVSFGSGISVDSFIVDSDTQITASITIAYGATPGLRDVSVTTGAGTGALANAFTVDQAPPGMLSVTPDQAIQGQTFDVVITGTHFTGTTSVSFGAEIVVNSYLVDSDTQITASISVDPNATPGPRDVAVTTPAGTVNYLFTVNQAPPTVTLVTPNQGIQGQTIVDVAINGTYFTGATSVSFGAGISVDSFTVSSATQILATITISPAAMPGARDVSVTAPGGTAALTNGFTVASASPTVT